MNIGGEIVFEGSNSLRWIQKQKDGMIDLLFDNQDEEFILEVEPGLFKTMLKMMGEFDGKGTLKNPSDKPGNVKPGFWIWFTDDDVDIEVDLYEDRDTTSALRLSNRKGKFSIDFSEAQAKEIGERCGKILEIKRLEREVQEKKTIKAVG